MEQARPIVVRPHEEAPPPGPPTPGMDRRELFDHEDRWVGWVQTDAGLAGGWHHHGARDSYIYVIRGRVTIEYGPTGREQVTAVAGDFIFNPARMVHREITAPGGAGGVLRHPRGDRPAERQRRRPRCRSGRQMT